MVFNAIFKNISVISWQSVLFVEETGVSEKTTNLSQVNDKLTRHRVSVLQTMHVSGWTRLLHDKYYDSKPEVEYLLIILI
jgi:hypothetical protein